MGLKSIGSRKGGALRVILCLSGDAEYAKGDRGAAMEFGAAPAAWHCRMMQEEGLLWGSSHIAGLQNIGREKGCFEEAHAVWDCRMMA